MALEIDTSKTRNSKGGLSTAEYLTGKVRDDGPIFEDTCHREFIYYGQTKSFSGLVLSILVILSQIALYSVLLNEGLKKISEDRVNVEVGWEYCSSYNEFREKGNSYEYINNESLYIDPYIEFVASQVVYNIFVNINNTIESGSSTDNIYYDNYTIFNEVLENANNIFYDKNTEYSITGQAACEADNPPNLFLAALLPSLLLAAYTMPDIINGFKAMYAVPGYWSKFASVIIILENIFAITVGTIWAYQGWWKEIHMNLL